MATSDDIKKRALELSEKTDSNSISPKEVGGIMHDLASLGENALRNGGTLGIRKVYASIAEMEADKNPKDLWGNPLKKGNLVVIYDGTTTGTDNNKVYAYMNPGWQFATYLDAGYATRSELSELETSTDERFTETDAKLSELGSKVLTNSFIGNDLKYSSATIKGLVASRRYKIELQNLWDISNIDGINDTLYHFVVSYFIDGVENRLIGVKYGEELKKEYIFTTPSYCDYIKVGGRAKESEEIFFNIKEILTVDDKTSAYLEPNNKIIAIKEASERNKDLIIEIEKKSEEWDFYLSEVKEGVFRSSHYRVPTNFINNGIITFKIPSDYSLVLDSSNNLSIITNADINVDTKVLACCSFGSFVFGAFENIINDFKSKKEKTELNIISFEGKNNIFSESKYNNVLSGHTYKVSFINTEWSYPSDLNETDFIFKLAVYCKNGRERRIYYKHPGQKVDSTIYFTIHEIQEVLSYLQFSGRADEYYEVKAVLEDVTYDITIDNSLKNKFGENETDIIRGAYYIRTSADTEEVLYKEANELYCLSPCIPIKQGDIIEWSAGFEDTATYSPVTVLLDSEKKYVNYLSNNANPRTWTYSYDKEGYSYIQIPFIISSVGAYIKVNNKIEFKWDGLYSKNENVNKDKEYEELFLGDLINSDTANGELDLEDVNNGLIRVTSKSVCCLPYDGVTIKIKLPKRYNVYFWYGTSNGEIPTYSNALRDGDTYTFPSNAKAYRCVFRDDENNFIFADSIQKMIDEGEISFKYKVEQKAVNRNVSTEAMVMALKRILMPRGSNGTLSNNGINSMAVFGHISDLHGDATRLINCFKICDYYKVDGLFGTGDMTMYAHKQHSSYQDVIASKFNTPYMFCIGNHEAYPSGIQTLYEDCIENLAKQEEYYISENIITDKCYWFKDFAEKSIRVIAINYYENGVYGGMLGQEQITWFVNTLLSTPNGFGVVVMLHSPEDRVVAEPPYDVFRQKHRVTSYQEEGFYVGNKPIMRIIDAFISRNSINISYNESNGDEVSVNADFSSVGESTEFIAYACGHRHEDWIGYYANSEHKQLCLDITSGIALYGDSSNAAWANQSDLPRGGEGVTQDAFNIYAIDRTNGTVKIVRIGANRTESFELRDCMIIPYK